VLFGCGILVGFGYGDIYFLSAFITAFLSFLFFSLEFASFDLFEREYLPIFQMLRLHLFLPGVVDWIGLYSRGGVLIIAEINLADMLLWCGVVINAFIR
jgi:hypothetical protein